MDWSMDRMGWDNKSCGRMVAGRRAGVQWSPLIAVIVVVVVVSLDGGCER